MDWPFPAQKQTAKSDAWIEGFAEAERQLLDAERKAQEVTHRNWTAEDFTNPFRPGTESHAGFEEGVYTFTQK